jgi:mono/diheme cytochrome c family protein
LRDPEPRADAHTDEAEIMDMRTRPTTARWLLVVASATFALTGCEAAEDALGDATGGATFTALYDDYLNKCGDCHSPDGDGDPRMERNLDFTTRDTAYTSITTKNASMPASSTGAACDGVAFVGTSSGNSLLLAVVDKDTRDAFDVSTHPGCNSGTIIDMNTWGGTQPPAGFVSDLKAWLDAGAPNN